MMLLVLLLSLAAPAERPPGLALTFESASGAPDAARDARPSRLLALYVPSGSAPTPFLPAGSFTAVWDGYVDADLRDDYTFAVEGRGEIVLSVEGKEVLKARGEDLALTPPATVELKKGPNRLEARYRSPERGDVAVRIYWSSFDIPREPVSARALSHDPAEPFLRSRLLLRAGREALAERRCLRCHPPPAGVPAGLQGGMPELEMDAPSLNGIGARLEARWIAHWVNHPHALLARAVMPRMFAGGADGGDARAWDIAAYLSSLVENAPPDPAPAGGAAAAGEGTKGERLFADLGCFACHSLDGKDPARVPLDHVSIKWKPAGLVEFLRSPEARHRWTRMPNFHLTAGEGSALAAFLLSRPRRRLEDPPGLPTADAERGRRLVESSGCLDCHALAGPAGPLRSALRAPPLEQALAGALKTDALKTAALKTDRADRGCLAASRAAGSAAPDFELSAEEREGILEMARRRAWQSLAAESAAEFAARQMRILSCSACHARDGNADVWTLRQEEGRGPASTASPAASPAAPPTSGEQRQALDQTRPHLTWTGEKLKPEWMADFLAGRIPGVRPWLRSRMPAFPARADLLARGLALEHGAPPSSLPEPPPDPGAARAGRKLALREGGFGCVSCHGVGAARPVGAFEVEGVNFQYSRERLRRDFYMRWMLNPVRVAPETRMPQFAGDDGRSPFTDIYEGDGRRQFEAIWQYLLRGRSISLED